MWTRKVKWVRGTSIVTQWNMAISIIIQHIFCRQDMFIFNAWKIGRICIRSYRIHRYQSFSFNSTNHTQYIGGNNFHLVTINCYFKIYCVSFKRIYTLKYSKIKHCFSEWITKHCTRDRHNNNWTKSSHLGLRSLWNLRNTSRTDDIDASNYLLNVPFSSVDCVQLMFTLYLFIYFGYLYSALSSCEL
jgi:hypothetical protein